MLVSPQTSTGIFPVLLWAIANTCSPADFTPVVMQVFRQLAELRQSRVGNEIFRSFDYLGSISVNSALFTVEKFMKYLPVYIV